MVRVRTRKETQSEAGASNETESGPTIRASISFPADIYRALESLAKQKKVSLAWVVRDATERYVVEAMRTRGRMR